MKKLLLLLMLVVGINSINSQPLELLGLGKLYTIAWMNNNPEYELIAYKDEYSDSVKIYTYINEKYKTVVLIGFRDDISTMMILLSSESVIKYYIKEIKKDKNLNKAKKNIYYNQKYYIKFINPKDKKELHGVAFYLINNKK